MNALERKVLRGDILKICRDNGTGKSLGGLVLQKTLEYASYELSDEQALNECRYLADRGYLSISYPEASGVTLYHVTITSIGVDVVEKTLTDDGVEV